MTMVTFIMPDPESRRAETIIFRDLLCEINLSGLNILSKRIILITPIFTSVNERSRSEVMTMKKSS